MKPQLFLWLIPVLFTTTLFANRVTYFSVKRDTTSAATIIDRSKTAYANLPVYLDSGKVVESIYNNDHPNKTAKVFRTAYTNTGAFNFEYYVLGKSNSLYTINRSSGVVRSWWGITNKVSTPATINLALAGATGVSSRTSAIIPDLLLTKNFKQNFYSTLSSPHLNGSEKVGMADCYKISGLEMSSLNPVTVWIGKNDLLIRKIETDRKITPEKSRNLIRKMDSINEINHKTDTLWLKNKAARKAANARRDALLDAMPSMRDFNVKTTYLFYPYLLKRMNPELLEFRPNREIAL